MAFEVLRGQLFGELPLTADEEQFLVVGGAVDTRTHQLLALAAEEILELTWISPLRQYSTLFSAQHPPGGQLELRPTSENTHTKFPVQIFIPQLRPLWIFTLFRRHTLRLALSPRVLAEIVRLLGDRMI